MGLRPGKLRKQALGESNKEGARTLGMRSRILIAAGPKLIVERVASYPPKVHGLIN